jgi:hypothetical protein
MCNHTFCGGLDFEGECVLQAPFCELCKTELAIGTAHVSTAVEEINFVAWVCEKCKARAEGINFIPLEETNLGRMRREHG